MKIRKLGKLFRAHPFVGQHIVLDVYLPKIASAPSSCFDVVDYEYNHSLATFAESFLDTFGEW